MRTRTLVFLAMLAVALPAFAARDRIGIADETRIGEQWSLVPGTQLMPPYPEAYASEPEEVCMVVGYLVNADGSTSDFSLLKSWASGNNSRARTKFWSEFGDLASRAVAQWKYAPRDGAAAKPVYTAATFVFGDRAAALETKKHCEVADLTTRLLELRYDDRAGRKMSHGIFGQLAIDPGVEERFRQQIAMQNEMDARARAARSRANEKAAEAAMPPPSNNNKK